MARRADTVCVAVSDGEEGVIGDRKVARQPGCRRVAGCASGRPRSSHVVGVGRSGEVRLVARVAIRRRSRKDVVDVATSAGHSCVRAG